MWPESSEKKQPLRTGLTTGTCATACCLAGAHLLLGNIHKTSASVTLPKPKGASKHVDLELKLVEHRGPTTAYAETIKDAGDDPDATHGATIWVTVSLVPTLNHKPNV